MNNFIFLFFILLLSSTSKSFANEKENQPKSDNPSANQKLHKNEKKKYFLYANYSPIDLIILSKIGFTVGLNQNEHSSWEFEYLRGSYAIPSIIQDLGKMVDERYSIIRRSYFGGGSFNLSYGVTLFSFSVTIGDDFINRLNANYPSANLLELQSAGFNFGVGNRWKLSDQFSFGVDWFSWSQPVFVTKDEGEFLNYASNQDDRDDIEKAKKIINYLPRLTFLKIQLGILF
ncbi:MAG: hypothetical protein QE271_04145 [Bacteriovoracaceae bacterium]|nr:hypothetical protein [Bacteriovoracaceae bacterium]